MRSGLVPLLLLLASCSTVDHSSASGFINDPDYATVFRNVTSATVNAGFIILSTSPDTGKITATRRDGGLSDAHPAVDITLQRATGGVAVQITSTVEHSFGGEVLAGSDKSTMQAFCDVLLVVSASATCKVQTDPKR